MTRDHACLLEEEEDYPTHIKPTRRTVSKAVQQDIFFTKESGWFSRFRKRGSVYKAQDCDCFCVEVRGNSVSHAHIPLEAEHGLSRVLAGRAHVLMPFMWLSDSYHLCQSHTNDGEIAFMFKPHLALISP